MRETDGDRQRRGTKETEREREREKERVKFIRHFCKCKKIVVKFSIILSTNLKIKILWHP